MKYKIEQKYLEPIKINKSTIKFADIHEINEDTFNELVNLYITIYNADNVRVVKELGIEGQTEKEGIWRNEEPWDEENASELIRQFVEDDVFMGLVATAKDPDDKKIVIGASIYKHTDPSDFKERGYKNPFPNVNIDQIDLFYVCDSFKRKIDDESGSPIRYLTLKMKKEINKKILAECGEALIYSATESKHMRKHFKKEGRTILERETVEGWKYQGYLYLK